MATLMKNQSDLETDLLERIHQGDPEAEKLLFDTFQVLPKISMMVRRRISAPREDLNDLINDIALSVIINLRKGMLDSAKGSLGTYIWGITRNKIRDYLKPNAVRKRQTQELDESYLTFHDRSLERKEERHQLRSAIRRLESKYRDALMMRYYEELSIKEMAEKLSLSVTQVYTRIHYALELLGNSIDINDN